MTREPSMVQDDVREGWISRERAESVYGVVINEDFSVDEKATQQTRNTTA